MPIHHPDLSSFPPRDCPKRYDIAIIGAGFSGTMLAVHLSASIDPPSVALIERTDCVGPGLAYGSASEEHLLNVPAGKMSAFPDQPSHFLDWAREHADNHDITAGTFLPRVVYGAYLRQLVAGAKDRNPALHFVHGESTDVEIQDDGSYQVTFADGSELLAANVILAWGNLPPTTPTSEEINSGAARRFIHNPWSGQAREALHSPDDVLIIGSGLSCLDLLATARKIGRKGRIHVLSRHGLFPQVHKAGPLHQGFLDPDNLPENLRELFKLVRAEVAAAEGVGSNWRPVIDSMRPFTQALWRGLATCERQRFLRHVRSLWETLRHRAAPEMRGIKDAFEESGQLIRHKGRLKSIRHLPDSVEVSYLPRGEKELRVLRVGIVINATGPEVNPERSNSPLLRNLLERGLAKPDPLGLGIEITGDHGPAGDPMHTVGSLRRGLLWESTAVPELRVQAAQLARQLIAARAENLTTTGDTGHGHIWTFEI